MFAPHRIRAVASWLIAPSWLIAATVLPSAAGCGRSHLLSRASASYADAVAWPRGDLGVPSAAPFERPHADDESDRRREEISENLRRGDLEAAAGRPDQAAQFYERVLRDDPDDPTAHHRLAVLADEAEQFVSAEQHYSAALETRPNDADLLNDLGYSYLLQGRYPEAEQQFRRAVASAPNHRRALTNLALLYAKIGNLDRALAVLRLMAPEDEARAQLSALLPLRERLAPEDGSLAPPLSEAAGPPIVRLSHVVPVADATPPAPMTSPSPLSTAAATASLTAGERLPRTASRLPGLIAPSDVGRAPARGSALLVVAANAQRVPASSVETESAGLPLWTPTLGNAVAPGNTTETTAGRHASPDRASTAREYATEEAGSAVPLPPPVYVAAPYVRDDGTASSAGSPGAVIGHAGPLRDDEPPAPAYGSNRSTARGDLR